MPYEIKIKDVDTSETCKTTIEDNIRADTTDYICDELPENTNLLHLKEPMILDDRDIGLNGINITDVCPTQRATRNGLKVLEPLKIKNDTKKGYLEATDGDGIYISSRMEYHRGTVQKDKIQTITTSGGNDRGVCVGTYQYSKSDKFMNGKDRLQLGKDVSDTLQTTPKEGVCYNDLRIRKLTPLETFRLMGVKDEDYYKIVKNQSNSSLYHLAGDSIVVNVLMAIFKELIK